ncbi:unnamed protein product [Plutella xylostella]|uniref:(diamondback moth) hypothetical protein n=1 Tax=Plutella xylostella TaxID=51655 RepID=A0A8S4D7I0_PLUXY|nr:unnamed protein product [Plutella xylostella]
MICPEGHHIQNEVHIKEEDDVAEPTLQTQNKKPPINGDVPSGSTELASFRGPKTWKKSITNFFKNPSRSRSNDGDRPTGSKETYEEKDMTPEQKWQSLGKIFRRQSFADHNLGESSSHQSKRVAVRKVLSSYFGKKPKSIPQAQLPENP